MLLVPLILVIEIINTMNFALALQIFRGHFFATVYLLLVVFPLTTSGSVTVRSVDIYNPIRTGIEAGDEMHYIPLTRWGIAYPPVKGNITPDPPVVLNEPLQISDEFRYIEKVFNDECMYPANRIYIGTVDFKVIKSIQTFDVSEKYSWRGPHASSLHIDRWNDERRNSSIELMNLKTLDLVGCSTSTKNLSLLLNSAPQVETLSLPYTGTDFSNENFQFPTNTKKLVVYYSELCSSFFTKVGNLKDLDSLVLYGCRVPFSLEKNSRASSAKRELFARLVSLELSHCSKRLEGFLINDRADWSLLTSLRVVSANSCFRTFRRKKGGDSNVLENVGKYPRLKALEIYMPSSVSVLIGDYSHLHGAYKEFFGREIKVIVLESKD
jgi:hypothetical protein